MFERYILCVVFAFIINHNVCMYFLLHVWGCMSVVQIYTFTALLRLAFAMVFKFTISIDHLYFVLYSKILTY